jgi:hypothetical protein
VPGDQIFGKHLTWLLATDLHRLLPSVLEPMMSLLHLQTGGRTSMGLHYEHLPSSTVVHDFKQQLCQLVHMESSVHWPWLPPQGIHLLLNVFNCLVSGFRLLGIFMFNLIWKNHRKLMTTNMCRCEILLIALVAKIYMTNTFIIANILLNWIHSVRDVYPAEEPRVNAPMAPCALADIVRCSKLWITVDARRCS